MATVNKIKISLRCDELSNWTAKNPVLNNGELAIVNDAGNQLFKIGNGLSTFSQLPFFNENEVKTTTLSAQDVIARSVSQGLKAKATPRGFAAGAFLSANANFSQALGYNAETKADDAYAFVWNGDDARALLDYYQSHGKGTFSINPISGLQGVFIGENSLCAIFDDFYKKSETSSSSEISDALAAIPLSDYAKISVDNEAVQNFKMLHISYDEYKQLIIDDQVDAHTMYVLSNDGYDDQFGNRIVNLGGPELSSDAATKAYVDDAISAIPAPDLSEYYKKTETSSAIEISDAMLSAAATTKDYVDSKFDSIPTDYTKISVDNEAVQNFKLLHISYDDYKQLIIDGQVDVHTMYMLSSEEYDDQFGNRIANVGAPISADDAATKAYVDDAIQQQPKVTKIVAGSNIAISPSFGTGEVTINATDATWGQITGNINNQTDLNEILQQKATQSSVDAINEKIPNAATSSNKLADKEFVNSSINNYAAFYLTKNANGDAFGTYAELSSATVFYNAGEERTPTKNDYCVVLEDKTKTTLLGVDPTTRYTYQGEWPTGQFEFQYIVNNTSLTQEQVNAINSGITKDLVDQIKDLAAIIHGI